MKLVLAIVTALLGALLLINTAQAQRVFNQAELDAMLAPIALQPDPVVSHILIAATHPDEVAQAARWSRAHPHLRGEDAVRAVAYEPWHPSVKALVAFPELIARMDESPQWLADLGEAFMHQQPHVMEAVQQLRRRAQAAGHLASSDYQDVYQYGQAIVVQPRTEVVYVPYYDPYVVYGPWWWPHYRPVFWRPWVPQPVFVTPVFFHHKPDSHRHHSAHGQKHQVHRPVVQNHFIATPYQRVPEAQRRPIVRSAPLLQQSLRNPMPAASGFSPRKLDQMRHGNGFGHSGNGSTLRKHGG